MKCRFPLTHSRPRFAGVRAGACAFLSEGGAPGRYPSHSPGSRHHVSLGLADLYLNGSGTLSCPPYHGVLAAIGVSWAVKREM